MWGVDDTRNLNRIPNTQNYFLPPTTYRTTPPLSNCNTFCHCSLRPNKFLLFRRSEADFLRLLVSIIFFYASFYNRRVSLLLNGTFYKLLIVISLLFYFHFVMDKMTFYCDLIRGMK